MCGSSQWIQTSSREIYVKLYFNSSKAHALKVAGCTVSCSTKTNCFPCLQSVGAIPLCVQWINFINVGDKAGAPSCLSVFELRATVILWFLFQSHGETCACIVYVPLCDLFFLYRICVHTNYMSNLGCVRMVLRRLQELQDPPNP